MPAEPSGCSQCGHGSVWGVEVRGAYDGILFWECPACHHRWPRFTEGKLYRQALGVIKEWEEAAK